MLISKKWIEQYLNIFIKTEELKKILNKLGFEVEKIKYLGNNIENIISGKILKIENHPNSKKMLICNVNIKNEKLKIITSDKKVFTNMIVPVAKINSKISGKIIKKINLKGIDSYGMFCSAEELGFKSNVLNEYEKNCVFSLPENTIIGENIKKILYLDDVIFDISIPTNRGDCYGIYNIAREVFLFLKIKNKKIIKLETIKINKNNSNKNNLINVFVNEKNKCHRYVCNVIENIKLKKSPLWIQNLLRNVGIRPINNIIDITNYIMIELGQPMHVFDLDKIKNSKNLNNKKNINIRFAFQNEYLKTLDNTNRKLEEEMLIIADDIKPIALAGIMGGLNTEVNNKTKNILLEAAHFDSYSIRKTSKKLILHSESSIRFEKGVSEENVKFAMERAFYFIKFLKIGNINEETIDLYSVKQLIPKLEINEKIVNNILGTKLSKKNIYLIFKKLDFNVSYDKENIKIIPLPGRLDIKENVDLIEEIIRIFGYNKIPEKLPKNYCNFLKTSKNIKISDKIKNLMIGYGFNEIINYSFINKKYIKKIPIEKNKENNIKPIFIENPLNDIQSLMRYSLLPGILETIEFNFKRQQKYLNFFEIGKIFYKRKNNILESLKLGVVVLKQEKKHWYGKEFFNFFYLKGILERLSNDLFIEIDLISIKNNCNFHPGKTANILLNKNIIGTIGEIHPSLLNEYSIDRPLYYFEIKLDDIKKNKTIKFKELSKYPFIERDLSILVLNEIGYERIKEIINNNLKECNIISYKLYDLYNDEKIKKGYKSITLKIIYQDLKKTLTDKEVNEYHLKLLNKLKTNLGVKLR